MKSSNKSREFFHKICRLVYLMGAPNYYFEELKLPQFVIKVHDYVSNFTDILVYLFILAEFGAFFTQHNLTGKQSSDLKVFSFCHPILYTFVPILEHHKDKVKYIIHTLVGKMKEIYNDKDVEKQMIRKSNVYFMVLVLFMCSALMLYGADAILQIYTTGGTFTTVITIWPDVNDKRTLASYVRVLSYLVWWLYVFRLSSIYIIVIPTLVSVSHQYKNLQSYFRSLSDIFKKDGFTQDEMERQYEEAFLIGINMHKETLRCIKLIEKTFNGVCGAQISVNVTLLVLLMSQMVESERTFANTLVTIVTTGCVLITTACLMWNVGDIPIEASHLPMAMYLSGWHNCLKQSALRVKPLLVVAMARSQTPVILRCFGIISLTYETYLSIVKSSYSVFSVLY